LREVGYPGYGPDAREVLCGGTQEAYAPDVYEFYPVWGFGGEGVKFHGDEVPLGEALGEWLARTS
jgi:hypothetical protein